MSGATVLELEGVSRSFGGLRALDAVSVQLAAGARHGLIGPNGAGKTTLFKLVSGDLRASAGRIRFAGEDVTRTAEHARACMGMAQTFQHSSLFPTLTCRDHVVLALQRVRGEAHRLRRRAASTVPDADALLERTALAERATVTAGVLSHGERRQLELAVALACQPRLLLLDEPAAGMSAAETQRLAELVRGLPEELAVLVIEHDLEFVFGVVEDVTVLHLGKVIASGPVAQIRDSEEVQTVYVGDTDQVDLFA